MVEMGTRNLKHLVYKDYWKQNENNRRFKKDIQIQIYKPK